MDEFDLIGEGLMPYLKGKGTDSERERLKEFVRQLKSRLGFSMDGTGYEKGFLEALAQIENEIDYPTVKEAERVSILG